MSKTIRPRYAKHSLYDTFFHFIEYDSKYTKDLIIDTIHYFCPNANTERIKIKKGFLYIDNIRLEKGDRIVFEYDTVLIANNPFDDGILVELVEKEENPYEKYKQTTVKAVATIIISFLLLLVGMSIVAMIKYIGIL